MIGFCSDVAFSRARKCSRMVDAPLGLVKAWYIEPVFLGSRANSKWQSPSLPLTTALTNKSMNAHWISSFFLSNFQRITHMLQNAYILSESK